MNNQGLTAFQMAQSSDGGAPAAQHTPLWLPQGPRAGLRRDVTGTGHRPQSHQTSLLALPGPCRRAAPALRGATVPGTPLAVCAPRPMPPPPPPERGPRALGTGRERATGGDFASTRATPLPLAPAGTQAGRADRLEPRVDQQEP